MFLEHLTLRHFRNYKEVTIPLVPEGAYISGPNGSGKTNLLEAMYYLANQASFRTTRREELQAWHASHSVISALVTNRTTQRQSEVAVQLTPSGRRLFFNGKETRDVRKFTSHLAAVAFHPGTMSVIKGGPAGRRYLVDRGIYSLQDTFGQTYQHFQRALKQRNALLRSGIASTAPDLAVWTEHFIDAAVQLMRFRQAHVEQLNITLMDLSQRLGEDVGSVSLEYQPAVFAKCTSPEDVLAAWQDDTLLHQRYLAEAQRLQRGEEAMGQTLFGPQRDDFVIRYRGRQSRGYASQGEQRITTFLLVAALALEIHRQRGYYPIVLLDDVVSELDEHNRRIIFDFLRAHTFQVFITDVKEQPQSYGVSTLASVGVRQVGGWAEITCGVSRANGPSDAATQQAQR